MTAGYLPPKNPKNIPMVGPKRPFAEELTTKFDETFNTFIHKLTTAPVLGFAMPKSLTLYILMQVYMVNSEFALQFDLQLFGDWQHKPQIRGKL